MNISNIDRVCVVPKVFRTRFTPEPVTRVMKLDQRKIHWIIKQKQKGGDYKTDCSGYEDLAQASPTNLEKLCREQARACNRQEHGTAQEAL